MIASTSHALEIPEPLVAEHEALHRRLREAIDVGGDTGAAARALARLMHPHFEKENELALPPLGLLPALARGEPVEDPEGALQLADRLLAEYPAMLAEHTQIAAALQRLGEAARRESKPAIEAFAADLLHHARTEEAVMYPAALLVGRVLRARLS